MTAPRLHGCIQLDPVGWPVGDDWSCNQYVCQVNEIDVGRVAVLYPKVEEEDQAPQQVQALFVDLPGNPHSVTPWHRPRRLCSPQRERILRQGGEPLAECLASSIGEASRSTIMHDPYSAHLDDAERAILASEPWRGLMQQLERVSALKQAAAVMAARPIVERPCDADTELMLDDNEAEQAYARYRLRDIEVLMGGAIVELGLSTERSACEATSGEAPDLGPWQAVTFYEPSGAVAWTALHVSGLVLLHSYEDDLALTLIDPGPLSAMQSARYYCGAPTCREE